jgi:ATP-dependent Clp protease ATP-binding subunit ClpA
VRWSGWSEFHDKHSIARLVGAPPGYVGYEGEGQLTRAVRTRPFCVLLLDEVEKAHPDVFDIFLQVFDDGRLTDAKGRTVNFTNSIIIMTSNLGSRAAAQQALKPSSPVAAAGEGHPPAPRLAAPPTDIGFVGQLDAMPEAYQNALRGHFRPEFLNRIDEIVVFRTLQREDLRGIVQLNLARQIRRIQDSRQIELELTREAIDFLLTKGYHPEFGARPLQRAIDTWLTKPFAEEILRSQLPPGTHVRVLQAGEGLRFESAVPGYVGDTLGGAP